MKKLFFILFLLIFLSCTAYADEYSDLIDKYTEKYSEEIEDGLPKEGIYSEYDFPRFDAEKIIGDAASGKPLFSFESIKDLLLKIFIPEIKSTSKSMIYLFSVTMLGGFLLNLINSGMKSGAAQAGNMCIYLISAGVIANIFSEIMSVAYEAVNTLSLFLKTIFPVMIMSLFSAGCISSTYVLKPYLAAIVEICVHIIKTYLMPSLVLAFATSAADCMSDKIKADKFVKFLTKSVKWALASLLTIFTGVIGLQSVAASSFDGLTVKLTKLATSNLVPIVGGLLSETVETVMNCSVVIKNSVGICGILGVVYICIFPILRIGINVLFLRFSAAVLEPVGDEKVIKCLSSAADVLSMLLGIVASVAVMFVLIITIIINTGNSAVLLGR